MEIERVSTEEGRKLFKQYFGKKGKANKYHARKMEVDGIKFDSQKEANYYWLLKQRQRMNEIQAFELKPRIELQPAFTLPTGEKVQAIVYIPDFVIVHLDGSVEIVDVKGMPTESWKLKWKLLKYKYRTYTNHKFTVA